jgi:MarR family transcriptional regulator, organic hydroperoxide resistance regulator
MRRHTSEGGGGREARAVPAEELVDALGQLFMHVREHFERGVQRFDLPGPCAKALRVIDGAVSMKDLGARIHCDASFVTAIADMLEERGLARREVDPEDRRIKKLVLTAKGTETRTRVVEELFCDVPGLRKLSARERESLLELLHKMLGREQADAGVPSPSEDSGSAA